jgi:hypothetical protein
VGKAEAVLLSDCTVLIQGWISWPDCIGSCGDFWIYIPAGRKDVRMGVELFHFLFTKEGIVPDGLPASGALSANMCNVKNTTYNADQRGRGCTAWALINENMEDLHCSGLNWETKKTCK